MEKYVMLVPSTEYVYNALLYITHTDSAIGVIKAPGGRPLLYIGLPTNHVLSLTDEPDDLISVHGCVSYSTVVAPIAELNSADLYWIGWDYAHCTDFSENNQHGERWSLSMLKVELYKAIRDAERLSTSK